MTTIKKLNEVVTACGNVLRGVVEVTGTQYQIECDLAKTHLQIIDGGAICETCDIDQDGDVLATGGELVTGDWSQNDWYKLTMFVGAKELPLEGKMCVKCAKPAAYCYC